MRWASETDRVPTAKILPIFPLHCREEGYTQAADLTSPGTNVCLQRVVAGHEGESGTVTFYNDMCALSWHPGVLPRGEVAR